MTGNALYKARYTIQLKFVDSQLAWCSTPSLRYPAHNHAPFNMSSMNYQHFSLVGVGCKIASPSSCLLDYTRAELLLPR